MRKCVRVSGEGKSLFFDFYSESHSKNKEKIRFIMNSCALVSECVLVCKC